MQIWTFELSFKIQTINLNRANHIQSLLAVREIESYIFTHLKLCLTAATHNLMQIKLPYIYINQNICSSSKMWLVL